MTPSHTEKPRHPLRRRLLIAGTTSMALYLLMIAAFTALAVGAGASLPSPGQITIAVLCGLAVSFLTGALLFGALPHWLATLMERSSSMFELLNKSALGIALVSVLIGVLSALLLIFGVAQAAKPLLVAITLFLGAAAAMCSLKFFYVNRNSQ